MSLLRKAFVLLLLFLLILPLSSGFAAPTAPAPVLQQAAEVPQIRVGLWVNQPSVVLSADVKFAVVDNDTGAVLVQLGPKEKLVAAAADKLILNGRSQTAKSVSLVVEDSKSFIEVNKRHYRGTIELMAAKKGLTVINRLPVEEYVYGIIGKEISPYWPMEAIKAQAVASRSYALANLNKHAQQGFDVCATTDCQVYGGVDDENLKTNRAIDETAGMVLTYQGKVIPGYFHSSGGGYTENSENVWASYLPYLRGVADFDQTNPNYSWEKQFSAAELQSLLERAGYAIGKLEAVELSALTPPPVRNSLDRGISGRVNEMMFIGSKGSVTLPGTKVRSLLSLKSTLFDISVIVPANKTLQVEITDSYGDHETKEIPVNLPPNKQKGFLLDRDSIRHISGTGQEQIVFSGFGSGHGLGMSQWGAKAMAEKAPAGSSEYFKTILKHYYQGIEIKKLY
mgnify:CR=1 FL=1